MLSNNNNKRNQSALKDNGSFTKEKLNQHRREQSAKKQG